MQSKPAKPMTLDLSVTSGEMGREDCQEGWQRLVAPMLAGMTVLDVGSGLGLSWGRLREHAASVTRQDVCPGLPGVDVSTPVSEILSSSYDAVTAFDVIEHVVEDVDFVADLVRIARRLVVITTPNENVSHAANGAHCREYTPTELFAIANRPGWRIDWWVGSGPGFDAHQVGLSEFVEHRQAHQAVVLRRVV